MEWREEVQLYRHCDGYPTSVLPSLLKAFESGQSEESPHVWPLGRAGYAAAYIIAATYESGIQYGPYIAVEPESGFDLHCDIEWLYLVNCINPPEEKLIYWDIVVYRPRKGFWDKPAVSGCDVMAKGRLEDLVLQAKAIEEGKLKTKEI